MRGSLPPCSPSGYSVYAEGLVGSGQAVAQMRRRRRRRRRSQPLIK